MGKILIAMLLILEIFSSITYAAPNADYIMTTNDFYNECFGMVYNTDKDFRDRIKTINAKYSGKSLELTGRVLNIHRYGDKISYTFGSEDIEVINKARLEDIELSKWISFDLDYDKSLETIEIGDYITVFCNGSKAYYGVSDKPKNALKNDSNWHEYYVLATVNLGDVNIINHYKVKNIMINSLNGNVNKFLKAYYGYRTINGIQDEINALLDCVLTYTCKKVEISGYVDSKEMNRKGNIEFTIGNIRNNVFSKEVIVKMKNYNEAKELKEGAPVTIIGYIDLPKVVLHKDYKNSFFNTTIYIRDAVLAK